MIYVYMAVFYGLGHGSGYKRTGMKWETVFFNGYLPGFFLGIIVASVSYFINKL